MARAGIRLAIERIQTAPGTDWGPDNTAADAFTDLLTELLAHLDEPDNEQRIHQLFIEEAS
jgi:hypothetical protein